MWKGAAWPLPLGQHAEETKTRKAVLQGPKSHCGGDGRAQGNQVCDLTV